MKKSLFLMAAAALVMSACTQDVAEKDGFGAEVTGEVKVTATSNGTRTAITPNGEGNLDVTWVGGEDQIGIFAYDESEMAVNNAAYTAAESGSYSAFTSVSDAIQWGEGSHSFYAYYPYNAEAAHYTAVYANVPAEQNQSEAGNLEHIAPLAFMYASQTDVVKSATGVEFSFQNAFSVVAVNICSAEGNINCDGIIFRATDENEVVAATNVCVNVATGDINFDSAESSNEVKVTLETPATLDTETPQTIYAMITPGHAGKTFEALAIVDGVEVSLGEFAIPESGIPASALAVLNLNVPEPAPVNLSENGTANTYIVPALGKYSFKATVKGNGRTGEVGCGRWNESGVHTFVNGAAANNTQTSVDLAPASAELLWYQAWNPGYKQYALDCPIDPASVALVDGNIEFKTAATFIPGNAVIAAKDAEGKIIWSWHIWVSEGYDPEATAVNTGTYGLIAMDRNIGANIADFTKTDDGWVAAQAVGMLYQWGRKDPFPGPLEISDDTADGNRGGVGYGAMAADGTLMYGSNGPEGSGVDRGYIAIKNTDYLHGLVQDAGLSGDWTYTEAVAYANANPHRLIHNRDRSGNNYQYDWWGTRNDAAKAQILYVWGAPGWKQYTSNALKTIYDPCPAGWIVPSSDFGNVASGLEGDAMVQRENYGWSIVTKSGNKLYFPRTGVRWGDATNFQNCNTLGAYWSSLMSDNGCAAYNFVDKDGAFAGVSHINGDADKKVAESVEGNSAHSMGISTRAIRCVKESNAFVPSEPVEPEPEPEVVDLSATATSNCYIVNTPATAYKFKATVKGNGYAPMAGETAEIAPTKARLLWAQAGMTMAAGDPDNEWPDNLGDAGALDMIDYTTVELKDGYVHFTTGEEMVNGNAVLAVTNDEGTILWSWHLWILNDYDPAAEDYYVTASNINAYMMDRNLGATATPKNGVDTNNEWVGARGYFYQWGRKDPFPTHNIKWNGYEARFYLYDENGEPQKYDGEGNPSADGEVDWQYVNYGTPMFPRIAANEIPNAGDVYASVAYAVANPMTYFAGGASYMWVAGKDEYIVSGATNEWGKLWGNQAESYSRWDKAGVKTMYDPCPAGYRVPSTGHFAFITSHGDNAGASYNAKANWKYNVAEKIFDENGTALREHFGNEQAPYGFHFYVKGSRTATPGAAADAQDYGVAPEDATTAYFPAQGFFRWNGEERTSHDKCDVFVHTNTVKNASFYGYATYFMQATAKGEFFNNSGTTGYGEQQSKAMPVRCFRE